MLYHTLCPLKSHNTHLVFAKTSPYVATPELFAVHLASHMVTKYPHVQKAFADVELLKWSRIPVQGVEHKHSFVRDGEEKRTTSVEVSLEPEYTGNVECFSLR